MRPCPPPHAAPSVPKHRLPVNTCDGHCHVFGPAQDFPYGDNRAYTPADAPKQALFALHDHLGISRRVVVQASCYGTNNAAMLDVLRAKPASSRGVVSLPDNITKATLQDMHDAGVRGARFNFMARILKAPPLHEIDAMIAKFTHLGWHIVLHFDPDQIPELCDWIKGLDAVVLIDHAGRLQADDHLGANYNDFCDLMARPNIWTKLSGVERGSLKGAPYTDMIPTLQDIVHIAPDRCIWGTDWPHPVLQNPMPDDGALVDYIWQVLPTEAQRQAVLVDNPAKLYDF